VDTTGEVNEHYLGHVVSLAESSEVEASEDIVARNGMKLLAKGARIDARVKERLLQHKLTKPLESMMRVVDGVATRKIDRVAETLLERHPLLSRLCGEATATLLTAALRNLALTPQVESMLSVYAGQSAGKLEHAVGIALLSGALAQELPKNGCDMPTLMLAGLLHDVGELYINPAYLKPGVHLTPSQWKHIVTHPIVGSHVLKEMHGAGAAVARIVLNHHERLDGFGYPQGLRGDSIQAAAQVLAVAEMLMGLLENGAHHAERAAVAMRLVPGEFNRALLDRVVTAARAVPSAEPAPTDPSEDIDDLAKRLSSLAASLGNFRAVKARLQADLGGAGEGLRSLLAHALERGERIRVAFSSTGLDTHAAAELKTQLEALDARVRREIGIVLRELQWRMGELERQTTIRSEQLSVAEAGRVEELITAMRVMA
jgi:HD-GYP domain-containing protein (c-di-GMP phosphodiesterase class II)